ncbi:MAG: hypothetical protein AAFY83_11535, partial [Pseudomonadota bacterium]
MPSKRIFARAVMAMGPGYATGVAIIASVFVSLSAQAQDDETPTIRRIPDAIQRADRLNPQELKLREAQNPDMRLRRNITQFLKVKTQRVHGVIFADLREDRLFVRGDKKYIVREDPALPRTVLLPDIEVYLKNTRTGTQTSSIQTDVRGVYNVMGVVPGTYNVCWTSKAYRGPCDSRVITVGNKTVYPQPIYLQPRRNERARVVAGTVTYEDGSICRLLRPSAGIDLVGETISTNESGDRQVVRANAWGQYMIPQVIRGQTSIDISCPQVSNDARDYLLTYQVDRRATANGVAAITPGFQSVLSNQVTTRTARISASSGLELYHPLPGSKAPVQAIIAQWENREARLLPPDTEVELTAIPNGQIEGLRWEATGGSLTVTGNNTAIWRTPKST